jgi:hypothetical protein
MVLRGNGEKQRWSHSGAAHRLAGRVGAYQRWAFTEDRRAATAAARAAFLDRFEREVDPDGTLAPAERARRAAYARKAHFTRMAYLSAKARRR